MSFILKLLFSIALVFAVLIGKSFKPWQNAAAVTNKSESLQKILNASVNEFKLPGVQAGIMYSDKRLLLASAGTSDFSRKTSPISNQNIFRIGSTTKMFVAALVCRLAEKNLLSLDSTIDKWFPQLPFASNVTVLELLNQRSGIEENLFRKPAFLTRSVFNEHKLWKPEEVIDKLMKKMEIKSEKRSNFMYANNNYLLLGLIAEKSAGVPAAKLLAEEFFVPLKMKNTYLLPFYNKLPENLISGYDEYIPFGIHEIKPHNTSWDSLSFTAGTMASTAEDLLIWLDAFFHNRVLQPQTMRMMRNYKYAQNNGRDNNIINYGLGLAEYELEGIKMEGHPGGGFGGECFPFYIPGKDISIVVVYNWSKKDNPAGKEIFQRIIKLEN